MRKPWLALEVVNKKVKIFAWLRREVMHLLYTENDVSSSLTPGTSFRIVMKLFEATVRVNGREFTDRVGANDAQEARLLLQQRHGPRAVPYLPRIIPS